MQILSPYLTLKKLCLPLMMSVALTSCGSSSGGGGSGEKFDLSHYLFPDSSRTQTYDDGDGDWEVIWQVNGNTLTATSDESIATITIGKDLISSVETDHEDDWTYEWQIPRFAKIGENIADEEEQQADIVSMILGSLSSKTFELGSEKRTYNDMIVHVYYDPEYQEVDLSYNAKGIGEVFWTYYYDCPDDIKLSMKTDFSAECEGGGNYPMLLMEESED